MAPEDRPLTPPQSLDAACTTSCPARATPASTKTNVPHELGEGIGTMLEQWCWLPDVLRRLSRHDTRVHPAFQEAGLEDHPGQALPPERIPATLVAQRIARRPGNVRANILGTLCVAGGFLSPFFGLLF